MRPEVIIKSTPVKINYANKLVEEKRWCGGVLRANNYIKFYSVIEERGGFKYKTYECTLKEESDEQVFWNLSDAIHMINDDVMFMRKTLRNIEHLKGMIDDILPMQEEPKTRGIEQEEPKQKEPETKEIKTEKSKHEEPEDFRIFEDEF